MPRRKLVSQLSHVEIITPRLEESCRFFVDTLGLTEVARKDGSVYLRCWGEWFNNSVILTPGKAAAVSRIGWRAEGAEELETAARELEADGSGEGWVNGAMGRGPAYRFRPPGGQLMELYWEVDRYTAPPELRSQLPGRPQRYPSVGIGARQIDHVTMPTSDPIADAQWWQEKLGYRFMEYQALDVDPDTVVFALLSTNEQSHDLGLLRDQEQVPGRVHHVAFWLDQVEDLKRAVDVLVEAGTTIEFGPGRHAQGETGYLYFREPGGMRIELYSGGYRNYQPDWEPIRWLTPSDGAHEITKSPIPEAFLDVFPLSVAGSLRLDEDGDNPWVETPETQKAAAR